MTKAMRGEYLFIVTRTAWTDRTDNRSWSCTEMHRMVGEEEFISVR